MPVTAQPSGQLVSSAPAPDALNTIDELGTTVSRHSVEIGETADQIQATSAALAEVITDAPNDGDTLKEINDKIAAQASIAQQFSTTWADLADPLVGGQVFVQAAIAGAGVHDVTTGRLYVWRVPQSFDGQAKGNWDLVSQAQMEWVSPAPSVGTIAQINQRIDLETQLRNDAINSASQAILMAEADARSQSIANAVDALIDGATDQGNTLKKLEDRISGQRPESSAITWDTLASPLVEGERFQQARNEDGAEWLFSVPPAIAGEDKGAAWTVIEEARYTAIGVPPAGVTQLYLDSIRIFVRSFGTNAGSRVALTFYDVDNNPYPSSRFVVSGTLFQWAGGANHITLERSPWTGGITLGHNKQGYVFFYWVGGEAQMNGLSRIEVAVNAASVGQVQLSYLNSPEAVTFANPAAVTTTRFTTRPVTVGDLIAKVEALEQEDVKIGSDIQDLKDANKFIAIPAEGIELDQSYFAIADASFQDVVAEQVGETVFIANDSAGSITLSPPSLDGTALQFLKEDGATAATFEVKSGETAGFRLATLGSNTYLREFPNEGGRSPEVYGAIADLPNVTERLNGEIVFVFGSPIYQQFQAVGNAAADEFGSRWVKIN